MMTQELYHLLAAVTAVGEAPDLREVRRRVQQMDPCDLSSSPGMCSAPVEDAGPQGTSGQAGGERLKERLLADLDAEIGHDREVVLYTTAHPVYDWGWTRRTEDQVAVTQRSAREHAIRRVTVEDHFHAHAQAGRYASGLEGCWTPAELFQVLRAGFARLTPEVTIRYYRAEFDTQPIIDSADAADAVWRVIKGIRERLRDVPDASLEASGYLYTLVVPGSLTDCVLFDDCRRELHEVVSRLRP